MSFNLIIYAYYSLYLPCTCTFTTSIIYMCTYVLVSVYTFCVLYLIVLMEIFPISIYTILIITVQHFNTDNCSTSNMFIRNQKLKLNNVLIFLFVFDFHHSLLTCTLSRSFLFTVSNLLMNHLSLPVFLMNHSLFCSSLNNHYAKNEYSFQNYNSL